VLPEDAISAEETAARELQAGLREMTGVELPIQKESAVAAEARQIAVGPGERFRAACPEVDLESLRHDGIVMKTRHHNLYLAGGRPRGTLYAVYTFLEDVAGCRWWSASEAYIPKKSVLAVPDLDTVYVPAIEYREAFYRGAFDGVFAARLKCNGHHNGIPEEYGGHYRILGWCHTFYQLMPPEKYFAEHPEWYSEINGQRVGENAQLCLTNPEIKAEFIKNTLEWIRKDPGAGMISISQNDCGGACQCAACRALEEQEGAASGPLLHFVNAVAAAIETEFPDTLIETLAYQYTRQAPRQVTPRRNVVIRLCSIECSFCQPLETGAQNATFRRDVESWSVIAPQLYVWDYVTNFRNYILPHPNLRVLGDNIRFFAKHKTIGLFEQGDSGCSCSDFPELRAWVLAHLMWNPALDENALIREFLRGYYGAAAGPLQQYIDLIHDAVERSGIELRCYMEDTSQWLTPEDMSLAAGYFDDAQRRVKSNEALAARVRRARLPLDHAWLLRYHALRRMAAAQKKPMRGLPEDPAAFCEDFIAAAQRFDVGQYREGRPFDEYAPLLRARFRPPAAPPAICQGLPETAWVDVQDNEFTLYEPGRRVDLGEDPQASDGKAARMPGNHTEWAVQYPVSADLAALGPVQCYAMVRCDASAAEGPAFQVGLYDTQAVAPVTQQTVTIPEAAGVEYRLVNLGGHTLTPGVFFWMAPMNTPDTVSAVYADRIFFVKAEKP
jgi:hypothetical protein